MNIWVNNWNICENRDLTEQGNHMIEQGDCLQTKKPTRGGAVTTV